MSTTAAKTNETVKSRMSTRDIVLIGMFAALLGRLLPDFPAHAHRCAHHHSGLRRGFGRRGTGLEAGPVLHLVYILLGAVGLPVFANFQGGLRVITGLTGGYILAWPGDGRSLRRCNPRKKRQRAREPVFLHRTVSDRHAVYGSRRRASVGPAGGR